MRAISGAVRAALAVGGCFALVDVWQVALVSPGGLSAATVSWLGGLYLMVSLAAGLGVALACRAAGLDLARTRAWTTAIVAGAGTAILASEAGLRQFHPLSSWRPLVVAGACVGAALVARAAFHVRRVRAAVVLVGVVLFVAGAVGATRGFERAERERPASSPAAVHAPNILVVLIDTLRADHLGCYGYDRPTSPAIDAFAREGVQFLRAYSQSTWTKPATASVLTGRFPRQHQAFLEKAKLPESELLLAEALSAAGYRTGVFSGNPWITHEWGFAQGVDHFVSVYDERFARVTLFMMSLKRLSRLVDHKARVYNRVKMLVQGELSTTARDPVVSDAFLEWVQGLDGARFYAHLHLMSPHHPYDPPPPYDRFVPDRTRKPVTYYPKKGIFFFEEGAVLSDADRADMLARYDGDVLFADHVFGGLLARLRALGRLDDTVVVLLSDHGEEFFDHRNWGHGQSVYEELTHVPLLMRFPAALPAGRRVDTPVMTVDVMPTLLALAGAPALDGLAGRNLLPVIAGAAPPPREAYSELLYRYGEARALVDGTDKVIDTRKDAERRRERFDLARDPREQDRLDPADATGTALGTRLDALTAWGEAHRSAAVEGQLDADMQKQLKALGYLEE
jgi:arylsulfatase A-like enzyme